jgi:hypothetical protein
MPPVTHSRTPLWTALRGSLKHTRDARATRRGLERDLASYTGPGDLNDLHAILDRYSDEQTADIRRILSRRAA